MCTVVLKTKRFRTWSVLANNPFDVPSFVYVRSKEEYHKLCKERDPVHIHASMYRVMKRVFRYQSNDLKGDWTKVHGPCCRCPASDDKLGLGFKRKTPVRHYNRFDISQRGPEVRVEKYKNFRAVLLIYAASGRPISIPSNRERILWKDYFFSTSLKGRSRDVSWLVSTGWNDKIVVLRKKTLQLYFKTFIEKINSGNLIM